MRVLFLTLALPLVAQSPEALANAERAFAAKAERAGTRTAFLTYLADDSVVFTPRAQAGHAYHEMRPEDGSALVWGPTYVELSASGDFGISTGPFSWAPKKKMPAEVNGHFLSVWGMRQGRWQVLLDVGIPHEAVAAEALQGRRNLATALTPDMARRSLISAEEALDQLAVTVPYPTALKETGTADLRVYRPGLVPAPGNFQWACRYLPSRLTWVRKGLLIAPSGDLACTWGESDEGAAGKDGKPKASRSTAVRIWRRERAMEWRLLVDLAVPIPDESQKP
jgi:ketosteroid isomerase-like protein